MRPRSLDEFVGQASVMGPGRLLRRAIEADQVPSLILWGPHGSGKTTLAEVIARRHSGPLHWRLGRERRRGGPAEGDRRGARAAPRWANGRSSSSTRSIGLAKASRTRSCTPARRATCPPRRYRRKSFFRSQQRAPLALSGGAAGTARRSRDGRIVDRALADPERGIGRLDAVLAPDARALCWPRPVATPASPSTLWRSPHIRRADPRGNGD